MLGPRQDRGIAARREPARGRLVAEQVERRRPRADEAQAGGEARAGEPGVLAEEAVAGMDGVAAGVVRDRDDPGGVEVGGGAGAAQRDRDIRPAHVQRIGVVGGVDRDRGDPELRRRLRHPDRDLSAIGNEELLQHVVAAEPTSDRRRARGTA